MNRISTLGMICVLLVAGIGMVPAMGSAQGPPSTDNSDQAVSPGELLTGVVGVQGAEIEGEVAERAFGIRVAQAATNDSRAGIVKANLDDQEARLSELQERKHALEQARDNESISNGSYNAQVAVIAAETANIHGQLNASENASEGLPVELLESKGINVTAIQTLKHNASELSGPEVATIAKSIAGPEVGKTIAGNRAPVSVGPPDSVDTNARGQNNVDVNINETEQDGSLETGNNSSKGLE